MAKVPADDWRRTGQERFLARAKLVFRPWRESRAGWDHDHCEFCFAKLMTAGNPNTLSAGYCTPDEYRWICPKCFDDFKEEFDFQLIEEAHPPSLEELQKLLRETQRMPEVRSGGVIFLKKQE
jgi:hypothetical protein